MSNYQRLDHFFPTAGAKLHRGQGLGRLGPERVEMEDWLAVFADVYIVYIYIWMWVKMEDLGDHRC